MISFVFVGPWFYPLTILRQYLLTLPILLHYLYFGMFGEPFLCQKSFDLWPYLLKCLYIPVYWVLIEYIFNIPLHSLFMIVCPFDSYFCQELIMNILIFRGSIFSSNSFPIFSTVFLYASGEFDMMCVIVYALTMCMFNFHKSPLSSLILVIHSSRSFVTSSSFYFENFLRSLILEEFLIGSFVLRVSTTLTLRDHIYFLSFFFFNDLETYHVFFGKYKFIVRCIVDQFQCRCNYLVFFCLYHTPEFSCHLLVGHCISWLHIFPRNSWPPTPSYFFPVKEIIWMLFLSIL